MPCPNSSKSNESLLYSQSLNSFKKLLRKDNKSRLLGRSINEHGRYDWNDILANDDVWQDESLITDRIKKEISFDPDLWVLEIETEEYWNPLESEPL